MTTKYLKRNILDNSPEAITKITDRIIKSYFTHASSNISYPLNDFSKGPFKVSNFSKSGLEIENLLSIIDQDILDQAIYKTKTNYLKFVDNGISSVNIIAGTINSLLNQNLTAHLTDSPGATIIEMDIIANLRKLAGFPYKKTIKTITDIGGYFTSGGMMGNTAALLIARNKFIPNAQKEGLHNVNKYKIIVANFSSHYSTWQSAGWLGFGEDNVIQIKTKGFCYDINELQEVIERIYKNNEQVLLISVALGDPYSMGIDNIKAIRKICDEYGIWLHGDGANGGVLIFSSKYKHLVSDINMCDSISLDPHKAMGLNYPTSVFICKKYEDFNSVISSWIIINKKDSFDLGATTPFLNSREFNSLRLWLQLKSFGLSGIAKMIDNKIDTTKYIYSKLKGLDGSVFLWNEPTTFSILFQVIPASMVGKFKDDDYFKELYKVQVNFKLFMVKNGLEIHDFDLPIQIGYPDIDSRGFTKVLCIHNAHEKVSDSTLSKLVKSIKLITKQY